MSGSQISAITDASLPPSHWLFLVADPVRMGILRSLSETAEATAPELAEVGKASVQTMRRHLGALVAVGIIDERAGESDGETAGRPAVRFSLRPDVRQSVRSTFGAGRRSSSPPAPAPAAVRGTAPA